MKIDFEKSVEEVAKAIYVKRNGVWDYNLWRSDSRISEAYTKDAQAAIKAFCRSLPDASAWHYDNGKAQEFDSEMYQQLKQWGEK